MATAGITDVARSAVAHRAKILLVDDRAENLLALEAILSALDQELVFVRSGEAAVEAVLADEFAVILLDVVMPGMDGFETAVQIKQRGRTPNAPIIFLTAAGAEPELAFRGYAAGAVDYISKPFDPWVLRAKVSVFVDLYLKERQLRVLSDLSSLLSAIEEAAAGLAGLPAALASGALTDTALTDGLAQLDGAIASLRSTLSFLPGGRPPVSPDVGSERA
ncbi:MAG: response regulator receiver protein [Actinomycetia bacterium]|nr:response regulator receiver protein [Actinomycetes bacterium]